MLANLYAVLLCATSILANPVSRDDGFTLRIVHTNDMHARFEQTSKFSSTCSKSDAEGGKCYGGFGRIATLVREARNSSTPTLFLNAGDTYQGTIWFNVYGAEIVTKFMNILAPDAASLGNHEFDNGVKGLLPFLSGAEFPVVTANLDLSKEPELARSKLKKSTILQVDGAKIGVIGYLTQETKIISSSGNVIFKDEVESIREEVKSLKDQGVNILIALGHSGYDIDRKIAAEVEDIDLVIGGHTNTFLYTGEQPDIEVPEGLYPTEIVQKSGRKVYVVQAYAYTKYLGNFNVSFDSHGEVTRIQGNPILVDSRIKQAQDVLDELDKMRGKVDEESKRVVGTTRVFLDGDSKTCRRQECNLGNLITDAMIDYYTRTYLSKKGWTDTAIAMHNSGSIRTSITRNNEDKVTAADVTSVLPFNNMIQRVALTGEKILEVLEWNVKALEMNSTSNLFGAFLQVSGLQIVYDLERPQGSRVVSVFTQCAACRVPEYHELEKNKTYNVLITDFMLSGGDGYEMLKDLTTFNTGMTTAQVVTDYLQIHSPVHPSVDWRISFAETGEIMQDSSANIHISSIFVLLPVIWQLLIA